MTTAAFDLDRTLAALADPHRRRVVEMLHEEPMRAGRLAAELGLAPPAMSRHLRVLRANGLVEESHPDEDARVRIYRLQPVAFAPLTAWLEGMQAAWSEQLEAFRVHVEGTGSEEVRNER
jgi:DNA-binding transcriptional ArsR family regulator